MEIFRMPNCITYESFDLQATFGKSL